MAIYYSCEGVALAKTHCKSNLHNSPEYIYKVCIEPPPVFPSKKGILLKEFALFIVTYLINHWNFIEIVTMKRQKD